MKSEQEIKESKMRTHKLRVAAHIKDALRAKKRATKNLAYANKRLLELGFKDGETK